MQTSISSDDLTGADSITSVHSLYQPCVAQQQNVQSKWRLGRADAHAPQAQAAAEPDVIHERSDRVAGER